MRKRATRSAPVHVEGGGRTDGQIFKGTSSLLSICTSKYLWPAGLPAMIRHSLHVLTTRKAARLQEWVLCSVRVCRFVACDSLGKRRVFSLKIGREKVSARRPTRS